MNYPRLAADEIREAVGDNVRGWRRGRACRSLITAAARVPAFGAVCTSTSESPISDGLGGGGSEFAKNLLRAERIGFFLFQSC